MSWSGKRRGAVTGQNSSDHGRFMGTYGMAGSDLLAFIARHDEHETGETPISTTRRFVPTEVGLFTIPQWHRQAECAKPEYDGLDFFHLPPHGSGLAKQACGKCPVRLDCLEDALSHECEARLCFGLRGGMLAAERLALIRQGETRGLVYFGWGSGLVKIGTTRGSVDERARTHGIHILATEPGSFTRERQLHKQFAVDQAHGEWFHPSEALLAYIAALPDQHVTGRPALRAVAA